MTTISERLRRGPEKYRTKSSIIYAGPTLQDIEAADTIDALVEALEAAKLAEEWDTVWPWDQVDAALSKAKGKQE